jgi:Catalase
MFGLQPPRHISTLPGAAVARLMGRPVCPRLRKCRVRPAVTLGATSRHSRGPPATAAVDLSCEQAAAIIAHDRESHGRDLSLAIEGGDFPRWTLFIQMMTDAQAKAFRFNPF